MNHAENVFYLSCLKKVHAKKAIFPTDSHSIKTLEVNEETLLSMYLVVRPSSSYFKIAGFAWSA